MQRLLFFTIVLILTILACRKKEDPIVVPPPVDNGTMGKVSFTFQNVAGTQPLVLDTEWYTTENGDALQINQYKYYVTNFVLHTDTSEFKEWESYYLIDESKASSKNFVVDSIPAGRYTKVSFIIGVDAKRNTSGAQTGALDVANTMFWDWKSGYIMAKLDGVSPQAPGQFVSYHIAGFNQGESVLRTVTLNLPQPIDVKSSATPNIHIKADVLEWFKTPRVIKIAELPAIGTTGSDAMRMADNYADMFTIDHID